MAGYFAILLLPQEKYTVTLKVSVYACAFAPKQKHAKIIAMNNFFHCRVFIRLSVFRFIGKNFPFGNANINIFCLIRKKFYYYTYKYLQKTIKFNYSHAKLHKIARMCLQNSAFGTLFCYIKNVNESFALRRDANSCCLLFSSGILLSTKTGNISTFLT